MKRIFLFLVAAWIVFFIKPLASYSQQIKGVKQTIKTVNYFLPEPGILPDHPLYFLKALRDKILEITTFDPKKKADLLLRLSDKKISMALKLSKKSKFTLALKTAYKSEKDFKKLLVLLEKNKSLKDDPSLTSKIKLSHEKHIEVIYKIIAKSQLSKDSKTILPLLNLLKENSKKAKKI